MFAFQVRAEMRSFDGILGAMTFPLAQKLVRGRLRSSRSQDSRESQPCERWLHRSGGVAPGSKRGGCDESIGRQCHPWLMRTP